MTLLDEVLSSTRRLLSLHRLALLLVSAPRLRLLPGRSFFPVLVGGRPVLDSKSSGIKMVSFLSALFYHCLIISASHFFLSCSPIVQAARSCQQFSRRCGKARLSYSSYRGQVKVVVDLHERDVELRDLKDAGGLVGGRVQLLQLELPLQALHCVQSCCLVLLPHQKTRL